MLSRIRSLAAMLVIAILAFFVLPRIQAQPVASVPDTLAVRESVSLPLPRPASRSLPSDMIAFAAIGATAKKKATRKAAGKKRDMPMYLDSDVHVLREDPLDPKRRVTTIVRGGRMLDDLEDDALTDDEIDELIARRVLRPATVEEVNRANNQDKAIRREELVADQTTELNQLRANREGERAALVAQGVKPEDLINFDGETAQKVADLQGEHAEAIAKLDAE